MFPQLTPSAVPSGHGLNVPPPRFRPLVGPTSSVRLSWTQYKPAEGLTSAQRAGLRYEAKVQEHCLARIPNYVAAPYLHFIDAGQARSARPDGIACVDNRIYIFEIKYSHCPEAWWQLEKLYRPLVALARPGCSVSLVEVCRSFDPSIGFPCDVMRIDDIATWLCAPRQEFGVWVWRP